MHRVIIGLGSNVGDRLRYLRSAATELESVLSQVRRSSVFESAPMYDQDQDVFLNAVCVGITNVGPLRLLAVLKGIEVKLGRVERRRNGPREIDLDLLDYGGIVLRSQRLCLPHRGLAERRFVIEPLLELIPDFELNDRSIRDSLIHNKEIYEQGLERLTHAAL